MDTAQTVAFAFNYSAKRLLQFKEHWLVMIQAGKTWLSVYAYDHFVRLVGQHVRTRCTHFLQDTGKP
jgi:hypothetical protein